MRRYVFAGNWKMNKTVPEAVALARALREGLEREPTRHEVVVMPPFTALAAVGDVLKGSAVELGAQNMHWEREGAFTGEVSPAMLRDVGCTCVILGHSERRHIFEETDEGVGRKARAAFDNGLTPIVCVGETLAERESNRTLEVVERQVEAGLRALKPEEVARMLIAYEPVWAIGTGKVATPEQAQEVQAFLRKRIALSHGDEPARAVRVLYGGSVNPANTPGIMAQADVDGVLVGGASLKPESFLGIVNHRES
jgi:triosephosphate isomerase